MSRKQIITLYNLSEVCKKYLYNCSACPLSAYGPCILQIQNNPDAITERVREELYGKEVANIQNPICAECTQHNIQHKVVGTKQCNLEYRCKAMNYKFIKTVNVNVSSPIWCPKRKHN